MSSRRSGGRPARSSGKLALKVALITGAVGIATSLVVGMTVSSKLGGHVAGEDAEKLKSSTTMVMILLSAIMGGVVAGTAFALANGVASRLTDLSLAVSKMGRGVKAAVRVTGSDEVTTLGRALSALASEMAGQSTDVEAGGRAVDFDPQIRELRDKALPTGHLDDFEGFEVDGALSAGSRGGLDYFGSHAGDGFTVLFHVAADSASPAAAFTTRLARDELVRAFGVGANARKALAHTNRVLHKSVPKGVCATATLLEIAAGSVKVYQAGARVPVILCSAGQLEDVTGEGLALGLDSGPVFEKGLRSQKLDMNPGMRLVVLNDAGNRNDELVDSIQNHSPKHTAPFMNMVLGELEAVAGDDGLREDVVLLTVKRS